MDNAAIIAWLRKYRLLPTQEELAADKEEQVEVFVALFQKKTTVDLIAITRNRFYVTAAWEAAHLIILARENGKPD